MSEKNEQSKIIIEENFRTYLQNINDSVGVPQKLQGFRKGLEASTSSLRPNNTRDNVCFYSKCRLFVLRPSLAQIHGFRRVYNASKNLIFKAEICSQPKKKEGFHYRYYCRSLVMLLLIRAFIVSCNLFGLDSVSIVHNLQTGVYRYANIHIYFCHQKANNL